VSIFRNKMERREAQWGFLFISPWIIGLAVFYAFPIVASLLLTFFDASLTGAERHFTFIGVDNWIRFFNDPMAWKALGVTVRFTLLTLPVGIFVPLAVALILNSKALVAPGLFRVLWFLPYVIPFVAGIIGWLGVIGQNGPLNTLLELFGVKDAPLWTNDPGLIYPALVLMGIWGIGSAIVVYLSGLGSVPTELYEAAMVDGAGWWASLRHITLPMITPVIFYNLILGVAGSLQYFLVPQVLNGGNGNPEGSTLFFNIYLFKSFFTYQDPSYGATLAWVLFLITLGLSLILFGTQKRWVYYAGGDR
jgi:ABC-type sugar transport system permease subunit